MPRWPAPSALIRGWRLWSLPRRAVAFLLAVEIAAVAVTVVLSMFHPVDARALRYFGIVVVLGVIAAEATRGTRRTRRWSTDTPHVHLSSVWTLSAALLTTPALAAATVVVLYAHQWARGARQPDSVHPYRVLFDACVAVLCCQAAGETARALPAGVLAPTGVLALPALASVVVAYWLVGSTLTAVALPALGDERSPRALVGGWHEHGIEYATLCMGVLTASLLSWRPWLAVLVLPPLYVLHRSGLVRQLEHAATVDEQTGLLNAATWHSLAATEFARARARGWTVALLMADLDHFTQVNERFGRDVGDVALQRVGEAVRQELRPADLCGRLGGEEFAVLLADREPADALRIAEQVCGRVRALSVTAADAEPVRLSVSIGVAIQPDAGPDLDELLLAADNALFAAKDAGRDRASAVRLGSSRSVNKSPRRDSIEG